MPQATIWIRSRPRHIFFRKLHAVELNLAVHNPGAERCGKCGGLFHNFLEHEVFVTALFRRVHIPVHMEHFLINRLLVQIVNRNRILADHSNLVVGKLINIARMRQDGGDVGGNIVAVRTQAHDQRLSLRTATISSG